MAFSDVRRAVHRPRSTFDYCVSTAIGLHFMGDLIALYFAVQASVLLQYAVLRLCFLPLMLLMMLIYLKARRV